jgi:hypothetical protein
MHARAHRPLHVAVLFAEDPNFRAIRRSTTRLFFNSFLFQRSF